MTLDQFLRESGMSRADFAKKIGVSEVSITRYIGRQRLPRPEQMLAISKATDGAVTPNDFLLPQSTETPPPFPTAAE